jgi:hypothetical protein
VCTVRVSKLFLAKEVNGCMWTGRAYPLLADVGVGAKALKFSVGRIGAKEQGGKRWDDLGPWSSDRFFIGLMDCPDPIFFRFCRQVSFHTY